MKKNFSFDWHRRKLSAKEYAEKMELSDESDKHKEINFSVAKEKDEERYTLRIDSESWNQLTNSSKSSKAYEIAEDVRKFEIDKYWQRTLYFWGFITAIYVAYFSVLKEFYTTCGISKHGAIPLVILSALGLFFCVSWFLASKGSKHWQENWENHIDMLEDEITGPLFKIYLTDSSDSFSVSKINIMAGRVLSLCAFGLFMFEIVNFVEHTLNLSGMLVVGISTLFLICTAVSLFVYANSVKGNTKKADSIDFDIKEYGASNEK